MPVGAGSIQRLAATTPALTAVNPGRSTSAPADPSLAPSAQSAPSPGPVPVRRDVPRAPESVPPAVRSELEPQFGESLADVRVHRGPEVGDAARSISAKAFATGGEVYLPDEHGPAASGEGRKILSHELTHVVQQRRLGADLPDEGSPAGAALEREAREVGGQATPVQARPIPASAGGAQRLAAPALPPRPSRSVPTASGSDLDPAGQAAMVARIQTAAAGAGIPANVPTAGGSAARPGTQRLADGGQPTSLAGPTPSSAATPTPSTSSGAVTSRVTSSSVTSSMASSTERSADDLDALAGQLYPRMRTRLRSELLTDRERSGRLFDR